MCVIRACYDFLKADKQICNNFEAKSLGCNTNKTISYCEISIEYPDRFRGILLVFLVYSMPDHEPPLEKVQSRYSYRGSFQTNTKGHAQRKGSCFTEKHEHNFSTPQYTAREASMC